MKKVLSFLALTLLVGVGASAAFIINDPATAGRALGLHPAGKAPARQVAQATTPAKPAATKAAEAAKDGAAADKPAATKRPPTRAEMEKKAGDAAAVVAARRARLIGPVTQFNSEEAPPADLYPITIVRRTFPDAATMSVEIAVKNLSGNVWRSAYITIKSPKVPEGTLYEIRDWQLDEVVGLEYRFPRGEVQDRMRDLRIVSVSGDRRESALADRIAQSRLKAVGAEDSRMLQGRRRTGDALAAPGLLAMLGDFQQPVTGIQVSYAEGRAPVARPLSIRIPEEALLTPEPEITLRQTSEERREVVELARAYHQQGIEVQNHLKALVEQINAAPYREAMNAGGKDSLESLRASLKEFNTLGLQLATRTRRSTDADIRSASSVVGATSTKLVRQMEAVEAAIKPVDPAFRIQ